MRTPEWLGNLWFARSGKIGNYAVLVLAGGLCLATAALVWFGYVATREWRRGTEMLMERRQAEAMVLVAAAIERDMKGATTSLLVPMDHPTLEENPPFDLIQLTAQLFAKFPYPESLLVWNTGPSSTGLTYSLNRAERRPAWDDSAGGDEPFPVILKTNPTGLVDLVRQVRLAHKPGQAFSAINVVLSGVPYQVVVHYFTSPAPPFALSGFAALTVNMNWVRDDYFQPVLQQASTIGGNVDVLSFSVLDQGDNVVATTGPGIVNATELHRDFPVLFIDRSLLTARPHVTADVASWSVHVRPTNNDTLTAAAEGSRRAFVLVAVSAVMGIGALFVTIRAVEAKSALAAMKSDFVAAVTHELKTPVAIIRLVGDTLGSGRYSTPAVVEEYARVLSREAGRLGKAIDQLLTYARYSQSQKDQSLQFSALRLNELLDTGIDNIRPALIASGCDLQVDVPSSLPLVSVDRAAIMHVIENVIDNALKYARGTPTLRISGAANNKLVTLSFADRGIGIPREDIDHVFDRFYRARNAAGSGSGLGLTIAKRILEFHGGQIRIRSTVHSGTEVDLIFPSQTSS